MPGRNLNILLLISLSWALPQSSSAQKTSPPRIGVLVASTADVQKTRLDALRRGLSELGYVEGKNIRFDFRYADGKPERLPVLATELLRSQVDLILAVGGTPPAQAAKNATQSVPIVMVNVADAIGDGLVTSLSHPGGNITGLSTFAPELSGKRLELIKEMIPGISRVAVLANRNYQGFVAQMKEVESAAQGLKLQLQLAELRGADDLPQAMASIDKQRTGALMTLSDPVAFSMLKQIGAAVIKQRLPSFHLQEQYVSAGGLVSYGPSYTALFHRAAAYVDKILKGAKPGDLAIEQPTRFELLINLKTAKQIGISVPPSVLARADRIIR